MKTNGVRKETKFNTQQLPISRLFLKVFSCLSVCVYVCASSLIVLTILLLRKTASRPLHFNYFKCVTL